MGALWITVFLYEKSLKFITKGEIAHNDSTENMQQCLSNFSTMFTNVSFTEIEGAGHWVHAEKPVEFLNAVVEFLD